MAPEAVQGSAPRHARRDRANSIALILSGTMLLWHLGRGDELEASTILLEERRADPLRASSGCIRSPHSGLCSAYAAGAHRASPMPQWPNATSRRHEPARSVWRASRDPTRDLVARVGMGGARAARRREPVRTARLDRRVAFGRGSLDVVALRCDGRLAAMLPRRRLAGVVASPTNRHTPVLGRRPASFRCGRADAVAARAAPRRALVRRCGGPCADGIRSGREVPPPSRRRAAATAVGPTWCWTQPCRAGRPAGRPLPFPLERTTAASSRSAATCCGIGFGRPGWTRETRCS
jgi:Isocitrate/isopropylmalate dehydrogenase